MENNTLTTRTVENPFVETLIKKCKNCGSVFVDDLECESCGIQLNHDALGEPLGKRSFYSIKENFYENLPLSWVPYFKINYASSKSKCYRAQMWRRFVVLTDYFFYENEKNSDRFHIFAQECRDLLAEMLIFNVARCEIISRLDQGCNLAIYTNFSKIVHEYTPHVKKSFWSKKLWGVIQISFLCKVATVILACVVPSFLILKYLTLSY